ncbi:alpha/beta-hydrolase [Ascobolus immersus RN42]|uniref:Alpha/beta-hydrolase n=1 Tax=Ascobolus immersus RN42 TaxID=1160509 RepID=A0A3N4ILJ1_ASCIM|nr:alpha/beta-hydrolase [Ascobolus immersus RN42]
MDPRAQFQRMTSSAYKPGGDEGYGGIEPYRIHVPTKYLELTTQKFDLARLPADFELPEGQEWSEGTPKNIIEDLIDHWQENYSWRKEENKLNQFPHFRTKISPGEGHDELRIHFIWKRSTRANAQPILLCHGWPGSFYEFIKVIDLLAEPEGEDTQAFHVVVPSLPGYGFSDAPKKPGVGLRQYAAMFNKLMNKLGYTRYYAQGGDWGYSVVRLLALHHSDSVAGIHVNNFIVFPPTLMKHPLKFLSMMAGMITGGAIGLNKQEVQTLKDIDKFYKEQVGYLMIQRTKPATLSYGLTDSPVGLLGWIREKLHDWTDDYEWDNNDVLTWFMLYWLPGPHGTVRTYKESVLQENDFKDVLSAKCSVPLGLSVFKRELTPLLLPTSWANMIQPVKFVRSHPEGGHFAAWEKPELLVKDLQDFLTPIIAANPPPQPAPETPAARPERPRPVTTFSSQSAVPTLNNLNLRNSFPLHAHLGVSPLATPIRQPSEYHELAAAGTPPPKSAQPHTNLSPNLVPPVTVPVTQPFQSGANPPPIQHSYSNVSGESSQAATLARPGVTSEGTSETTLLPTSPQSQSPSPTHPGQQSVDHKKLEQEMANVSSLAAAAGLGESRPVDGADKNQ